jgi:hypothetical protein
MSDLLLACGYVGGFSLSLVGINLALCALGRFFPRLGAYMEE